MYYGIELEEEEGEENERGEKDKIGHERHPLKMASRKRKNGTEITKEPKRSHRSGARNNLNMICEPSTSNGSDFRPDMDFKGFSNNECSLRYQRRKIMADNEQFWENLRELPPSNVLKRFRVPVNRMEKCEKYVMQKGRCSGLANRNSSLCVDCASTKNSKVCRFARFRLLKKPCSVESAGDGSSFVVYDPGVFKDHHKKFLPSLNKADLVRLDRDHCVHIIVHVLPAVERLYKLEALTWETMCRRFSANLLMPFWKRIDGHRELCDVCSAAIFNLHAMCRHCGYVECSECFIYGNSNGDYVSCPSNRRHAFVAVSIIPDVPPFPLSTLQGVLLDLRDAAAKFQLNLIDLPRYYKMMPLFGTNVDESSVRKLCNGRLVLISAKVIKDQLLQFHQNWRESLPIIIENVKVKKRLWNWEWFRLNTIRSNEQIANCIVDCRTGDPVGKCKGNKGITQQQFWNGYAHLHKRKKNSASEALLLKLKDFPPCDTFKNALPYHYENYCEALPMKVYTLPDYKMRADGSNGAHLNLAVFLPEWISKPDLGPKLYVAFGMLDAPDKSTTNLHLDITCAANLMCDVTVPQGTDRDAAKLQLEQFLEKEGFERGSLDWERTMSKWDEAGAIWTIWRPVDNENIRKGILQMVNTGLLPLPPEVENLSEIKDPIHDQIFYLTAVHRKFLEENYGVFGCTLIQMAGDLVFIPAGAAHQVQNLFSCIKAAEDFVTPEGLLMSRVVMEEFRHLTSRHANREDKLQLSSIIYFATIQLLSNVKRIEMEEASEIHG